jgi:hypothetical protein
MNEHHETTAPDAIVQRDRELRTLRSQHPRDPHEPVIAPPAAFAVDRHGATTPLARLRALLIEKLVEHEGYSEAEAIAIADTKPAADDGAERARERREVFEASVRKRMLELAFPIDPPELLEDVLRRSVPPTPATRIAGDWLREVRTALAANTTTRRALVLLGGVGLTKTTAAALCGCQFLHWRKTVAYVEEETLVHLWKRRTLQHEAQLDALLEADLLILDELGTSNADPNEVRAAVAGAFNLRIGQAGSHMIFVGNLGDDMPDHATPREREDHATRRFAATYGARLVDRLVQMGRVAHFAGKSMRGQPYRSPMAPSP